MLFRFSGFFLQDFCFCFCSKRTHNIRSIEVEGNAVEPLHVFLGIVEDVVRSLLYLVLLIEEKIDDKKDKELIEKAIK